MRYNLGKLDAKGVEHVTYGGTDLSALFEILSVSMDAVPEISPVTASVPGVPGSHYYGSADIGERAISMEISLHTHTRDPMEVFRAWRQCSPALWRNGVQRLYLDDDMYLNAMVTGEFPLEFAGRRGIVQVQFTCFDPLFYGRVRQVPLKAGENVYLLSSQYTTWPTISVEGAEGSVAVKDGASGCEVVVPDTDHAVIDCKAMEATVDGEFRGVDMARSEFFPLVPTGGPSILTLESGEGVLSYQETAL